MKKIIYGILAWVSFWIMSFSAVFLIQGSLNFDAAHKTFVFFHLLAIGIGASSFFLYKAINN